MIRFGQIAFFILVTLSSHLYGDEERGGENNFVAEVQLGFQGDTNAESVSIGGSAGTSLVGIENSFGFKILGGYKHHFFKQISLVGFLGYLNHSTIKAEGYSLNTSALDISVAAQFHATEKVFIRAGLNFPLLSTFTRTMDNKTDEGDVGGEFIGSGKIGFDILGGYDIFEKIHLFFGFSMTKLSAKKQFSGRNHPTAGASYVIQYGDIGVSQFIFGIQYLF